MDFVQAFMRRTPLRTQISGDDEEQKRKKEEAKKRRAELAYVFVKKWGPVFNTPVSTIMSIMNIESSFNPKKINPARAEKGGAWGLGQQMADEAIYKIDKIKKEYGRDFPDLKPILARYRRKIVKDSEGNPSIEGNPQDLLDPELNTVLTAWQLGELTKEFGDFPTVAAAYHQGSGAVRQRLNSGKPAVSKKQPKGLLYVSMAENARNQSMSYFPDMLAYVE